jgi:hypothetical protein
MYLSLASNSPSSCFSLLPAGITGEHHHTEDSFLTIVHPSSFFMDKWGAGDGTQGLKRASKHSTSELHPPNKLPLF